MCYFYNNTGPRRNYTTYSLFLIRKLMNLPSNRKQRSYISGSAQHEVLSSTQLKVFHTQHQSDMSSAFSKQFILIKSNKSEKRRNRKWWYFSETPHLIYISIDPLLLWLLCKFAYSYCLTKAAVNYPCFPKQLFAEHFAINESLLYGHISDTVKNSYGGIYVFNKRHCCTG